MIIIAIYYLLFFILYWNNRHRNNTDINAISHLCALSFILLFVFFGFRNITVLCDTPHYYSSLRDKIDIVKSIPWYYFDMLSRFEPGYQIFETIHAKLFVNPYSIIISSSLIITLGNILLFRNMNGIGLCLCLFLMLNFQMINQYSAIRQGIATVILYYAVYNMINGNIKKYVAASMLAISFHVTAVVALGLYPLKYLRINRKTLILFLCTFFVITNYLLAPLISIFSTDDVYLDTNSERTSFPLGSFILFLMSLWLFVSARRFYTKFKNVAINNYMWQISAVCLLLQALDVVFPIVGRVAMYFFPFLVSVYVSCLRSITDAAMRRRHTLVTFGIFFLWFVLYNLLKPEWYYLYPYSFMDFSNLFTGYEIDR